MSPARANPREDQLLEAAGLKGFRGGALAASPQGRLRPLNAVGSVFLQRMESEIAEAVEAACLRAGQRGILQIEHFGGSFLEFGFDAVLQPVNGGETLVLIVTDPKGDALRRALVESRQRYKDLVEAAGDFVWETDRAGRFVFLSGEALGYDSHALLGRPALEVVAEITSFARSIFQTRERVVETDVWLQRADGALTCQAMTAVPIYDGEGIWSGARGMGRDVTVQREQERRQKQQFLHDRLMNYLRDTIRSETDPEKILTAALSGAGLALGADGGMVLLEDQVGAISWGEPLAPELVAAARESLDSQGSIDLLLSEAEIIGERTPEPAAPEKSNGAVLFWCRSGCNGFGLVERGVLVEIAGQIAVAIAQLGRFRRILADANADPLTGLFNRRVFLQELERRMARHQHDRSSGALAYLDLNNLKAHNDAGGHVAGDRVLLTFARLIRAATRSTDLMARVGGDEFLVWLDNIGQEGVLDRAEYLLRRMKAIEELSLVADRPLGVSIGMAVYDGRRPVESAVLIGAADMAMYRAKARGGSGFEIAPEFHVEEAP